MLGLWGEVVQTGTLLYVHVRDIGNPRKSMRVLQLPSSLISMDYWSNRWRDVTFVSVQGCQWFVFLIRHFAQTFNNESAMEEAKTKLSTDCTL